jgi:alternate signal-mediated exported protein
VNKAFKGAVVGAAGVALLAGGFGTFATWTDSKTIEAGTVKSGELRIESFGTPSWNLGTETKSVGVASKSDRADDTLVMVPGDVFTMTQPLNVAASGDNLKAKLTVSGVKWTPGWDEALTIKVEYADESYTLPGNKADLVWDTPDEITALNQADKATVTFTYADRGAGRNTESGWALDMRNTTLTLQQTR